MKTILEYLSVKKIKNDFIEYIVCPYGDEVNEISKLYANTFINAMGGPGVFILNSKDAKKYFGNKNVEIYEIPEKYIMNLDELEEDINSGELNLEELENINN